MNILLVEDDAVKKKLNEKVKNVTNYEEAIPVAKDYKLIIRSKLKKCST